MVLEEACWELCSRRKDRDSIYIYDADVRIGVDLIQAEGRLNMKAKYT